MPLTALELCAGAGGQALGVHQAGFDHAALVEIDPYACKTLRHNRPSWNVIHADLRTFDGTPYEGVDLVCGGLPCPPFSKAGKQLGADDERNLFPAAVRVIGETMPRAVMIENVRGILDAVFVDFREYIRMQLDALGYTVQWKLLNASDYGVSQLRPRVVFVALRRDLPGPFEWPSPFIGRPRLVGELLHDLMASGGWKGAALWKSRANEVAPTLVGGSLKHGGPDLGPTRARRAWESLSVDGRGIANEPPPPDFVGLPRLTLRMAARVQGFPDDWEFAGGKTAAYRQIGNAFPPPCCEGSCVSNCQVPRRTSADTSGWMSSTPATPSFFAEARKSFHAALLQEVLRTNAGGIPSNADGANVASVAIAAGILRRLGSEVAGARLAGQMSGSKFETIVQEFLTATFLRLGHLRPGRWTVQQIAGRERTLIARYEQYSHLVALNRAAKRDPELAAALGNDYTIAPDVVIFRGLEPDSGINAVENLVDSEVAPGASLREVNGGLPLLHASISCKWTIRSDRVQNARSEALNLIRNRKGPLPHIVVVTGEPLPSRLSAIALGTGDIDCVYHFALPELVASVKERGNDDTLESLMIMIQGKRLKDISDLPLDLAIQKRMDSLDRGRRSENMRRIRSKDTKPEIAVRSLLHRMGYRFRLHPRHMPGKPDIVLPKHRKTIFVHGCFWHQHPGCREGRVPASRVDYWGPKLAGNTRRDKQHLLELQALGWNVMVVWECETTNVDQLKETLSTFLSTSFGGVLLR